MLDIKDIMETVTMIQDDHLDVRTITMGISLLDCANSDIGNSCNKIYEKICRKAENLVAAGEELEKKTSLPPLSTRWRAPRSRRPGRTPRSAPPTSPRPGRSYSPGRSWPCSP